MLNKTTKTFLVILTLITTIGLLMYSVKGFTTRYAQDDYCYGYRLRDNGFFHNQWFSYNQYTEYNGNRYSLTLSINVVELLGGPSFVSVVPMLSILLMALALSLLVMLILNKTHKQKPALFSICIGVMVTFFTIYLSPKQYQVFFWISGLLPYFAPLVIYTIIAVLFLHMLTFEKIKIIHMIVIGILTFFAGGFSETYTVWFAVLSGFVIAYMWFSEEIKLISYRARILLLIIFIVTLASMFVLAVSPYNNLTTRSSMSSIFYAIPNSLMYAVDFIFYTLKSAPIPYAVLVGFSYLIAHLMKPLKKTKIIKILRNFIFASVVLFFLCASTMFPSIYAMSTYPGPRALTSAHVSLLVYLVVIGWLLQQFQLSVLPIITSNTSTSFFLIIFMIVAISAYISRAIFLESQEIPNHQNRALMWDLRHEMILNAKISGIQDVFIPAFDSIFMITELQDNPSNWVNICAAQYYGVDSITAIENYNDIGTYPLVK